MGQERSLESKTSITSSKRRETATSFDITASYQDFLQALSALQFMGDIDVSLAARLTHAVDNSIYQWIPQAVVYPKNELSVQMMMELAQKPNFKAVHFTPKGGGTGTNGQSLNEGIIVDTSRYMHELLELNLAEGWVRVQTGIVKDVLNDHLKQHGFFFSPDTSTSNRATIGGMIATDASGAGSMVYGKTSQHILALNVILADGSKMITCPIDDLESSAFEPKHQALLQKVAEVCRARRNEIQKTFPRLNRFLTGYDVEHVWNDALTEFDISRIFAGAEGTLGLVTEAKLKLTPLPSQRFMMVLFYPSVQAALEHAPHLVALKATAVEMIDDTVLNLAQQDAVWHTVKPWLNLDADKPRVAMNMVEFSGSVDEQMEHIQRLKHWLDGEDTPVYSDAALLQDPKAISAIYHMRKKAVGLLGKMQGQKRPIPFIEDAAVPPETLAPFIMELRTLLDQAGLKYGMFGHVDAGVLHVRPALNLQDDRDVTLVQTLSDQTFALTQKYHGILWGEHGKGMRSSYMPTMLGASLYDLMRDIKTWFDPDNRFNPGKIATPKTVQTELMPIMSPLRADYDRRIDIEIQQEFAPVLSCNGNGQCFHYQTKDVLCPSFKVSADRVQSPKGRAMLIRSWLTHPKDQELMEEVQQSLETCLGCKACQTQCPVHVNIPSFKAKFLSQYYQTRTRPRKDFLLHVFEHVLPYIARYPSFFNVILTSSILQKSFAKIFGYQDIPRLSSPSLKQSDVYKSCVLKQIKQLRDLSVEERASAVVIVQDPFTTFFDAKRVVLLIKLIRVLGYKPYVLPFQRHGKILYFRGYLKQFKRLVQKNIRIFQQIADLGVPMLGLDAVTTLTYRDEYIEVEPRAKAFKIQTLQEWFFTQKEDIPKRDFDETSYRLYTHCTEESLLPETAGMWQAVLARVGIRMTAEPIGCCGMAGLYGHDVTYQKESRALFNMSWSSSIDQTPVPPLVTGYSCRSQVTRLSQRLVLHPIELLYDRLQSQYEIDAM